MTFCTAAFDPKRTLGTAFDEFQPPIARIAHANADRFSTSENRHDEDQKHLRKGPISQERWREDDGSAPEAWQGWFIY